MVGEVTHPTLPRESKAVEDGFHEGVIPRCEGNEHEYLPQPTVGNHSDQEEDLHVL